jgi:hypothetical protein
MNTCAFTPTEAAKHDTVAGQSGVALTEPR